MKYPYENTPIPLNQRKALNEKVLYLIDHDGFDSAEITAATPVTAGCMIYSGRTMRITMNTVTPKRK